MPGTMKEPPSAATVEAVKPNKPTKRKRKPKSVAATSTVTHTFSPTWSYVHISFLMARANTTIDAMTIRSCLLQALSAYFGDHGAAIPIDILHISEDIESSEPRRPSAYIRVPIDDAHAIIAGISSFTGSASVQSMRIWSQSSWLATLAAEKNGQDFFEMTADEQETTTA